MKPNSPAKEVCPIAVLGAGNGGCAVAADLSLRGHAVVLVKTSEAMHNENFAYLEAHDGQISLLEEGRTSTTRIHSVSRDVSRVAGARIVIIYIQSNYHEELIKRVEPFLADGQIVVVVPGYLSTSYFLKHSRKDVTIVEAESSFIDCRIAEPGLIKVGFRNVRNPLGVFPRRQRDRTAQVLNTLGFPFTYLESVVEAALHNPNLIVHTVGAIMSIPRIEKTKGDYCMYHEVFTPSVWRILEQLDAEKMNVLEVLGFARTPYVEACKYRNSLDETRDGKEVFFWYAAMPTRAKGPVVVDSRYIAEDVPQGLVLLEALGKSLEVATPVCTSLIEIASAALGRDLRIEGRTPARLGEANIRRILDDARP